MQNDKLPFNNELINGLVFFIIFVSDGKFDNSVGVRKRTD